MKEGEKRRSRQKKEAAREMPGGRLAAQLKFISTETSGTKQIGKKKVKKTFFFKQSFSDDKLPTRHLMSVFAPEFVFLHRRGSELMEFPKVFFGGEKEKQLLCSPPSHRAETEIQPLGAAGRIFFARS